MRSYINQGAWGLLSQGAWNKTSLSSETATIQAVAGAESETGYISQLSQQGDTTLQAIAGYDVDAGYVATVDASATWYVDNEHAGTNSGTQSNPFKSFTNLFVYMGSGDTAYIKATSTPYREVNHQGDCFYSTIYMDWTGSGTERGTSQAKLYASEAISTWTDPDVNGEYEATFTDTGGIFAAQIYGGSLYDYGVWYIESGGDIRILKKGSLGSLGLNEFHWDGSTTLYVNVGEDPDTGQIEACTREKTTEFYTGERLFGGVFQFGVVCNDNDGCYGYVVDGIEAAYHVSHGCIFDEVNTGTIFKRSSVHHNMGRGLWPRRLNAEYQIELSWNNIYNNGLSGIYQQRDNNGSGFTKLYNNVVYGNNTLEDVSEGGIYICSDGETLYSYIYADNNISTSNFGYDFYAEDNSRIVIEHASNNAYDSVAGDTTGGKWLSTDDQTGSISFTDATSGDFSLSASSNLVNSGRNATWQGTPDVVSFDGTIITDQLGDVVSGLTVDIGAFEYSPGFVITSVNQDHTIGSVSIDQLHSVLPGDVAQTQTIDNVTVSQLQSILVDSVAHVQIIDPLTFSVAGSLSINNILQTNVISNISLSQLQQLITNNVSQGQVVENVSVVVPGSLTINSILQPQNIDPQLLSHYSALTTNNISHGQLLDSLTVEQKHEVLCASINQGHTIDTTALEQLISLSVDSVTHSQNIDKVSFSTSLVVDGVQQGQTMGSLSVTQIASLIVDTINQGHYVDNLTFGASGRLRITVTTSKSGVTANADTYGNTIN